MDNLQSLFGHVLDLTSDAYCNPESSKTPITETELQTKDVLTHLADGAVNVLRSPRNNKTKTSAAPSTTSTPSTAAVSPAQAFSSVWSQFDPLGRATFVSLILQLLMGDEDLKQYSKLIPQYTPAIITAPAERAGNSPGSGASPSGGGGAGADHAQDPTAEHGAGSVEQQRRTANIHIVGVEHEQTGSTSSDTDGVPWWDSTYGGCADRDGSSEYDPENPDHSPYQRVIDRAMDMAYVDMASDCTGIVLKGAKACGRMLIIAACEYGYDHPFTWHAARAALNFLVHNTTRAGTEESRRSTPPFPTTASQAADMQSAAQAALQGGQVYKATPLLCMLALRSMLMHGPEHPHTVRSVYEASKGMCYSDAIYRVLLHYLLPRAAAQWGGDSADLRRLVQRAALLAVHMCDPRDDSMFVQVIAGAAMQLQGGLGWGMCKVAPLPDEEAYNRHVVLETQADRACAGAYRDDRFNLARKMYERCVAYYDSLGLHWLGTPRKVHCMIKLCACIARMDGPRSAESYAVEARHTAMEGLGPSHEAALSSNWYFATLLQTMGRKEKALSAMNKTLHERMQVSDRYDETVLDSQIDIARLLHTLGKKEDAKKLLERVYIDARHAHGLGNWIPHDCVKAYDELFEKTLGSTLRTA